MSDSPPMAFVSYIQVRRLLVTHPTGRTARTVGQGKGI